MLTFTKYPRIKYTPFSIWNTDPVEDALDPKAFAKGVPAAIVVFPNNPDDNATLHVKDSPSVNV